MIQEGRADGEGQEESENEKRKKGKNMKERNGGMMGKSSAIDL